MQTTFVIITVEISVIHNKIQVKWDFRNDNNRNLIVINNSSIKKTFKKMIYILI